MPESLGLMDDNKYIVNHKRLDGSGFRRCQVTPEPHDDEVGGFVVVWHHQHPFVHPLFPILSLHCHCANICIFKLLLVVVVVLAMLVLLPRLSRLPQKLISAF